MKPHLGRISEWSRLPAPGHGLGYVIVGVACDQPNPDAYIRTSYVVSHDEATGEIETRNSRYTLVSGTMQ